MSRPLPQIAEARRLAAIPMRTETLGNGLALTVVERRGLPVVEIEFIVKGGAEADTRTGLTSMMAEMADEGTASRSSLEIAEEIDHLGAHFSLAPGWHATTASLHVLTMRMVAALDIAADVMLNATFPEDEYRRKQDERLNALLQDADEAALVATKALARGVFGDHHPYGAPMDGTLESIERISCDDVARLYHERFTAPNTHILVVGDVDADAMFGALEQRFVRWGGKAAQDMAPTAIPAPRTRRILLVDKPNAAQAEIRVGHPGPARNTPDYFTLLVMNAVLGGSFTSRLNMMLRERMGVTYGAASRFRMRRNGGLFMAGSAVLTEAAARSAEVVVEEMERLQSEAVPAAELRRAQSYIALGLPRSFETTEDIASHVRDQLIYGLPDDYWQTYVDRVFEVTAEDVLDAAARHLHPDTCTIVIVADRKDVQAALEKTALGEVLLTNVAT